MYWNIYVFTGWNIFCISFLKYTKAEFEKEKNEAFAFSRYIEKCPSVFCVKNN